MPQDKRSSNPDEILGGYTEVESGYSQEQREQDIISDMDRKLELSNSVKSRLVNDWEFFDLYLRGEQLVARHRDTGEVVRLSEDDSKRLRSQMNILRPTARSLVGKMVRTIPTCVVLPATADFGEQHGARAANALLQHFRRKEDLDIKWVEAHEHLPSKGNAFLQLSWNRLAGRKIAICQVCDYNTFDMPAGQPCPQCATQRQTEEQALLAQQAQLQAQAQTAMMLGLPSPAQPPTSEPPQLGPLPPGQEIPLLQEAREGSAELCVRDPRHIHVEPGAESLAQAQWYIYHIALPVPMLRRMFPEHAEHIGPQGGIEMHRTPSSYGALIDSAYSVEVYDDYALYWEYHEKPSEMYPGGRVIYRVNDLVVAQLDGVDDRPENPYRHITSNGHQRFNLFHVGFDKIPGEFWREGFLTQAWHRQREINRLETQIREHVELNLKPKLFIPIGSRIAEEEITAASSQLVKYNAAAGRPEPISFQPLSQQVFDRRNDLVADVRMQASVTEQDAGASPSDPNGRAMAIIEAESDQQIGPILQRNWAEWRDLHRAYLQLFREMAHPETLWSISGPEGVQLYSFGELQLEDGWDIQVEQEDGLSRNPAIRLQQAMDLLNAGVFMDPVSGTPDIKAFMRHARIRLPSAGFDQEATERAAAAQIPYLMEKGQMHQPAPENDPRIFAEELCGWLRGPGRQKVKQNPMLVAQVREIWQFYMQWFVMGSPGGMAPMGAGPGGPQQGPGPGPGGPDMSARGGSANNPGHMGSDIAQNARTQVAGADRAAEGAAQVQSRREG